MTPRDIQTRVRSGESVSDLIASSGMPAERVEAYAAPILAEREHMWALALSSPVRRLGESASARRLRQVLAEALLDEGMDIDLFEWDAWRRSDGRWAVRGDYHTTGIDCVPQFVFDARGHYSVADNDDARHLVGDKARSARSIFDPDSEPTIEISGPSARLTLIEAANEETVRLPLPIGVTALDPEYDSDLDILYEMISGIDEDSVRIYRGLRDPITPEDDEDTPGAGELPTKPVRPLKPAVAKASPRPPSAVRQNGTRATTEPTVRMPKEQIPADPAEESTGPENPARRSPVPRQGRVHLVPPIPSSPDEPDATAAERNERRSPGDRRPDEEATVTPINDGSRPRRRSRRASVPSWDEIMFGGSV